jgi:predicted nuclease of predicted toxin-antitoxin system
MRFLIDAHLPRRLARLLEERGHQAIHTLDFPQRNKTTDRELMEYADANDFVVVTKDADFVDSFYLKNSPMKLWLISTGNITIKNLKN